MLRLLCFSFIFLFYIINASAQINELEVSFSKGTENAFSFEMVDFNYKIIQLDWKNYIKSLDGKAKKDKKTKEYTVENIMLTSISETPINLYSAFNKSDKKDCKAVIWFDLGESFLSSQTQPEKKEVVDKFINDFILFAYSAQLERKKAAEESSQPKLLIGKKTGSM